MEKDIKYITIDGRGEHESFRDCVTKALEDLKPDEGIHIIKDFEPFPMYKMMESKGFDKRVEKISDEEFHVYFFPSEEIQSNKNLTKLDLPKGHPIRTYQEEIIEIEKVLSKMEDLLKRKLIKNQWLELYDKLSQISIHFSRKQNQLFAALERRGFDKPSKTMWTLDNEIKDIVRKSKDFLDNNRDSDFLSLQPEVIEMVRDMMLKENEILFPTAMDLLTDEDFIDMRISDDEIGYCLIDNPPAYKDKDSQNGYSSSTNLNLDLLKDLAGVLEKHGIQSTKKEDEALNVSQGLLTLNQINLIFKHLPVDLSFVDENELVKFYSDTKHRVFPRSAGVIGREVQNCHPRESVETVEKIINAFRSGEQSEAEFWLEIAGKFIYIVYIAVRDENGGFKGVLEMMQDATHIRSLTGSQRLLSWENNSKVNDVNKDTLKDNNNKYNITKDIKIGDLVKTYPFLKEYIVSMSPKYEKLNSPILFKTMGSIATIEMISARGGFETDDFINGLVEEIDKNSGK